MVTDSVSVSPFGAQLRYWRRERGLSQLALAHRAKTTPRHISFVETGRSRPGRELVVRLGESLNLPARSTNTLLEAAGFGPAFPERALNDVAMAPILKAAHHLLEGHLPYPGCVMDAKGKVSLANATYLKLAPDVLSRTPEENIDAFYGEQGRRRIENWREVLWATCDLRTEQARRSGDPELLRLAARAREHLVDVAHPSQLRTGAEPASASPIVYMRIHIGEETLSAFSSSLRFETALDVLTSELRVELIFPADERSAELMQGLYG